MTTNNESSTSDEKRREAIITKFAEGLVMKTKALYEHSVDAILDIGMNDAESIACSRAVAYLFEYLADSFRKDHGATEEENRDVVRTLDKVAQILATRLFMCLRPNKEGDCHGNDKQSQGDPQ